MLVSGLVIELEFREHERKDEQPQHEDIQQQPRQRAGGGKLAQRGKDLALEEQDADEGAACNHGHRIEHQAHRAIAVRQRRAAATSGCSIEHVVTRTVH